MIDSQLEFWKNSFHSYYKKKKFEDKSHDLSHFKRVWSLCSRLSEGSDASLLVLLAGSYFHDLVNYPKDSDKRHLSSRDSAIAAEKILNSLGFPSDLLGNVKHCIEAHSYSAQIEPLTLEAKILQDADRMESLGAIGIARTFYVSGRMGSELFDSEDPLAENRPLDDMKYALDHFEVKLYKIAETMITDKGRDEAQNRVSVIKAFIENIREELLY